MKALVKPLALLALAGTITPPVLYLTKTLAEGPMKTIMLIAAVLWFATAPFFLKGGEE